MGIPSLSDEIDAFVEQAKLLIEKIEEHVADDSVEWAFAVCLGDALITWAQAPQGPSRDYYFWEKGEGERTVSACSKNCDLPVGHKGEHQKFWGETVKGTWECEVCHAIGRWVLEGEGYKSVIVHGDHGKETRGEVGMDGID